MAKLPNTFETDVDRVFSSHGWVWDENYPELRQARGMAVAERFVTEAMKITENNSEASMNMFHGAVAASTAEHQRSLDKMLSHLAEAEPARFVHLAADTRSDGKQPAGKATPVVVEGTYRETARDEDF